MTIDPDALAAEAARVLAAGVDQAMLARLAEAWRAHPNHAGLTLLLADALRLAGQYDQAAAAYAAALDRVGAVRVGDLRGLSDQLDAVRRRRVR